MLLYYDLYKFEISSRASGGKREQNRIREAQDPTRRVSSRGDEVEVFNEINRASGEKRIICGCLSGSPNPPEQFRTFKVISSDNGE